MLYEVITDMFTIENGDNNSKTLPLVYGSQGVGVEADAVADVSGGPPSVAKRQARNNFV